MKKMNRKHKYMVFVLVLGVLFSVGIFIADHSNSNIVGGNRIYRKEFGHGDYMLNLLFRHEDIDGDMDVLINEREYTKDELDSLLDGIYEAIKNVMLKDNKSLDEITGDIALPLSIEGYPFDLRWSLSDEDVIDRNGNLVCEEGCMKTHSLIATVVLLYNDYRQMLNYELRVVPKSYGAKEITAFEIKRQINDAIDKSSEVEVISLPTEYAGKPIFYKEGIPKNSVVMLVVTFVLAVVIGICVDYDDKKQKRRIYEKLEDKYVIFAERLKLYMISGLTVRNAIFEIRKNLESENEKDNTLLLERLNIACNKYINGCMEEEIINDFGASCEGSYRKLAYLLVVNLKKGNDKLIALMEEEVTKANTSRKERAAKRGDEASVKLLFPMMGMLLVVMALIILPAYLDFS